MITGIVVLNYNNYKDTINCVESVLKWTSSEFKMVIVDNGSTNDGASILEKFLKNVDSTAVVYSNILETTSIFLPKFSLVKSSKNIGYARGNNLGIKALQNDPSVDCIMILNNDILFIEDIIPSLTNFLFKSETIGIVSPLLLKRNRKDFDYNCARYRIDFSFIIRFFLFAPFNTVFHKRGSRASSILQEIPDFMRKKSIEIALPSGSCMLMQKSVCRKLNIFDPATFLYYEENIVYEKELKLNLKNYLLPSVKCVHLGAMATSEAPSKFIIECGIFSAKYFAYAYLKISIFKKCILGIVFEWYRLCWILIMLLGRIKRFVKN